MCARYYLDRDIYSAIGMAAGPIAPKEQYAGDVRPSERPPVIIGKEKPAISREIAWGYPGFGGKGLLINARSESIEEKSLFRNGILHNRCLLPASGFYEWDGDKNKVRFFLPGRKPLFLAGCFDVFQGERRFVIITTAAKEPVIRVHGRMPLLVSTDDVDDWLFTGRFHELLAAGMPDLESYREYEQLSLDL